MKSLVTRFVFTALITISVSATAQKALKQFDIESIPYLDRHPIHDYTLDQIASIDSLPDFESKRQKLKITGTIYKSDGKTPASDVIMYLEQADEDGDFDLRKLNDKRYTYHRGWIKTNASGQYTFYTFMPGGDRRYNQLQQLFPTIKEGAKEFYNLESFLFDSDPLLTKSCRKKIAKKGDVTRILKPIKQGDLLVVEKNIVLDSNTLVAH
jgi:protocatechuate 3,4-dioxygenase beta subunit